MVRRFARPYARAIMDVAGSPKAANAIREDLAKFDAAQRTSFELQEVFANPGIDLEAKFGVANKIASRLEIGPTSVKVLEVLIRNHRMRDLGGIIQAVTAYVNQATNTVVAEVRSAHELSGDELKELKATLEKKFNRTVEVELTTDPSLLGGFVAKVGSEIFDASVVGKIDKFRESLARDV